MSTGSPSKLANVIIPVADQDRAIEFYTETLGLKKRVELAFGPDFRWIEVAPAEADTTIALCPPGPGVTPGGKQTGISLQTDEVDAYDAELKARGVDVDAEVGRFGDAVPPTFWLRDHEATSCRSSRVHDRLSADAIAALRDASAGRSRRRPRESRTAPEAKSARSAHRTTADERCGRARSRTPA